MGTRLLSSIPLRVAPALVGQPLASPLRRAVAVAVDLAVVIVPSVAVAVAAALAGLALLYLWHDRNRRLPDDRMRTPPLCAGLGPRDDPHLAGEGLGGET